MVELRRGVESEREGECRERRAGRETEGEGGGGGGGREREGRKNGK